MMWTPLSLVNNTLSVLITDPERFISPVFIIIISPVFIISPGFLEGLQDKISFFSTRKEKLSGVWIDIHLSPQWYMLFFSIRIPFFFRCESLPDQWWRIGKERNRLHHFGPWNIYVLIFIDWFSAFDRFFLCRICVIFISAPN